MKRHKKILKYHRLIVLSIIFCFIVFKYCTGSKDDSYYPNGQKIFVGNTSNGKNEGIWTWYHPNGYKKMEGIFKGGKRNGVWKTWSDKGVLLTERTYVDDKLNGPFVDYDTFGFIAKKGMFSNDLMKQE